MPYRILLRSPNWLGDAVMALPAVRALRDRFSAGHLAVLAHPRVADLYRRLTWIDGVIPLAEGTGLAAELRALDFDCAVLLPNSFASALLVWRAGIPRRIGYRRDLRGPLLTDAIRVPEPGDIPRHQRFYYLELLRRAGFVDDFPGDLPAGHHPAEPPVIGVAPGASNSQAKQWLPERFAEAAALLAREFDASVTVFGSPAERELCQLVAAAAGGRYAGETSLAGFIEQAAACRLFLTNDSGAMHVAASLGVPTVAVFGPTDETVTGPVGPAVRIIREPVHCSPCLLRRCPIDHRCMTRVTVERVIAAARQLWTPEPKS